MRDILLVDGYNVVNAWPELVKIKDNLEYARDKLVEILAGYAGYKNLEVFVIFDAHEVNSSKNCKNVYKNIAVVFTEQGETADSYIEKAAYTLVRRGREVYVVTSDWAEQLVILGAGAYRISARELLIDVKKINKLIKERFVEEHTFKRHELSNRLNSNVLKRLNELRKGK